MQNANTDFRKPEVEFGPQMYSPTRKFAKMYNSVFEVWDSEAQRITFPKLLSQLRQAWA